MSENKNEPVLSEEQIDELLQNFQSDVEEKKETHNKIPNETMTSNQIESNTEYSTEKKPVLSEESDHQIFSVSEAQNDITDQSGTYSVKSDTSDSEIIASNTQTDFASNDVHANKTKKRKRSEIILRNFMKFAAIILLTAISTWILSSGDKMSLASVTASEKDSASVFKSSAANLMSTSLEEIYSMPKVYILAQNNDPAPVPNQNNFTKIEDPEYQNYDGTPIDYYKDETIEVKCWREMIDNAVFNFADIQIAHPSQFRRKLVDNVVSKNHLDYPLNIFKNMNGVIGMTSDYCAYRAYGTIVQYGKVVRDETAKNLDILIYDKNGNLSSMSDKEFHASEYFNSDDVVYTFAFGPVLVDDYTVNTSVNIRDYPTGEVSSHYPRAAIGQFGYDTHYLLCTVDYTNTRVRGTTAVRLAEVMLEKGCRFAYNMDGGQTAALMFNNELFNVVAYGGQREVSDIMYFATALPND